jgi:hypothetical protein
MKIMSNAARGPVSDLPAPAPEHEYVARIKLAARFTASLIHELSTPLQAILTSVEAAQCALADVEGPDLDAVRELMEDVHSSGKRAASTVARLRTFLSNAKEPEPLDFNRLIEGASCFLRSDFLRRGIKVASLLDPRLPTFRGDHAQIERVILNLLLDAADTQSVFSSRDRRLMIRTRMSGSNIRIAVENGADEVEEADFSGFSGNRARHRWSSMSAIATVEAHGGSVWVESRGLGRSFILTLPALERPRTLRARPGVLARVIGRAHSDSVGNSSDLPGASERGSIPGTEPARTLHDARLEIAMQRLRTAATFVLIAEQSKDPERVQRNTHYAMAILKAVTLAPPKGASNGALRAVLVERASQLRARVDELEHRQWAPRQGPPLFGEPITVRESRADASTAVVDDCWV